MKYITALAIVAFIFCSITANATEYHVSAEFKGGADGSAEKPFRDISSAAKIMKPGDTCIVHEGIYRETVTPGRSGTKDNPIVFRAASRGSATIVGSDPVTDWRKHSGHIYKATMNWSLGKNNQVFVNGKVMQEARWPNEIDGDPLTPDGTKIGGGDMDHLLCPEFPAEWNPKDLQGAVVWTLAGVRWNSWTATVTAYDPKEKKVSFPMPRGSGSPSKHNPGSKRKGGGIFYLVGALKLLDAPGEWFYDEDSKELYLWAPNSADPNALRVEAKSRLMGLALTGRSWITVDGINLQGCTIDLEKASYCTVRNSKAHHISHTRGGQTVREINEKSGIYMGGRHNRIESCEIAYSAGSGISLRGTDNAIVNCWIHHMDYIGAYCSPVNMEGMRHLISHNTIEHTGRDCILLGGAEHLIQYNNVGFAGRICNDLGVIYRGANDGGSTRIRYNFVHDSDAENSAGIYLDNYSKNYIVDHNVVWNAGNGIRLNLPTGFNMILSNTLFGDLVNSFSPWKGQYRAWGTHALNNLTTGTAKMYPEVVFRANILQEDLSGVFDCDTQTHKGNSPGKGKGIPIADITPREQVDVGAWQHGSLRWKAGHDFKNPPAPEYAPATEFLRNYIRNAAFEYPRYHPEDQAVDPLVHWTSKGEVTLEFHNGFNHPAAHARNSVQGNSLELGGKTESGVQQKILALSPDAEYFFSGYARHGEGDHVVFSVKLGERLIAEKASSDVKLEDGQAWRHVRLRFKTGLNDNEATVMITKKGAGQAYVDDTGVVPAAFYTQSEE